MVQTKNRMTRDWRINMSCTISIQMSCSIMLLAMVIIN